MNDNTGALSSVPSTRTHEANELKPERTESHRTDFGEGNIQASDKIDKVKRRLAVTKILHIVDRKASEGRTSQQMAGRSQELEAEAAKQKKQLYSRFRNTCKLLKAKRLDTLVTAKTWYANKRCKDRLCRQKKLLDTQAM